MSGPSIFDLPIFGPADIFPMLPDDELQELAASIKESGLQEPLVVAEVGGIDMLIDGRNRRAACKIVGVEPAIRRLNGEDPSEFVLNANVHRRHLTKGQRAMAVAMVYPKTRYGKEEEIGKNSRFDATYLRRARTVLKFAPDIAPGVLAGHPKLDEAYQEAKRRKDASNSDEARIAKLRERYPELADKVVEEELTLDGALAEARARDAKLQSQQESVVLGLQSAISNSAVFAHDEAIKSTAKHLAAEPKLIGDLAKRLRCEPADLRSRLEEARTGIEKIITILDAAPAAPGSG